MGQESLTMPSWLICSFPTLGFYGDGIRFRVFSGQSFWPRVLPGGACIAHLRRMPVRRIPGGGGTRGVSFWPFPSSSSLWWLINSMFLTSTACHKITYANGYCGAWAGWAVSVSVLLLTQGPTLRTTVLEHLQHGSTPKSDYILCSQWWRSSIQSAKSETRSWLWLRSWTPYCQIQTEVEESGENQ